MLETEAQLALLFVVGLITGFINTLAGGGSLLTLPVLLFLGLPSAMANGTNRIAIFIQNLVGIFGFRRHKIFPVKTSIMASIPALAGAYIGAKIAIDIPDALFRPILAIIMIVVMIVIIFDPSKNVHPIKSDASLKKRILFTVGFFGVGFYGGFIQAGVGFFIIALLLSAGYDLLETNAIKLMITLFFTVVALWVFIIHGKVDYLLGIILGLGNAIGAWIATHIAVRKGHKWIRGFVLAVGAIFAVKLITDSIWG